MGAILGLALIILVIYGILKGIALLFEAIQWAGFNMTVFIDNLLALRQDIDPVLAWGVLGGLIGLSAGIWAAGNRHRVGYLKPIALIVPLLILGGLAQVSRPLAFTDVHPYEADEIAQREKARAERLAWEKANKRYILPARGANIRVAASTNARRITTLPRGTMVYLDKRQGEWMRIQYRSANNRMKYGFVHADLVGMVNPNRKTR